MAVVKALTSKATRPWYSHLAFARYWQHYHQTMNAYRKAVESCFSFLQLQAGYPQSFYDHHVTWRDSTCSSSRFRGSGQHPHDSSGIQASTREDHVECDLSNMEITEELRQYFAETERHREERRRQQQLDAECLDSYVNADHDLCYNTHQSVEPPTERPGEQCQAEMRRLYGNSAAKLQAMEASVQLSFDKHCDPKQPKFWPVFPLKF
uniref:Gem nuclear organelle associated protein 8 n=1 Tax=Colobus angolensis palliatus TaxID=336983 RepID=A0A2K5ISC2_COLAP